jgi:two-component system LytT family response regulator
MLIGYFSQGLCDVREGTGLAATQIICLVLVALPTPYLSRFLVKDGVKEILLPVEKIDWIEAAEYYYCLHTNRHRYMVRETVTDLSSKLDPNQFVRIHRSSIVNLDRIREIYREKPTDSSVVLTNGQTLRMSKAGRQKLNEIGKVSN